MFKLERAVKRQDQDCHSLVEEIAKSEAAPRDPRLRKEDNWGLSEHLACDDQGNRFETTVLGKRRLRGGHGSEAPAALRAACCVLRAWWHGMAEGCEGAPVAVSGWVLPDRHFGLVKQDCRPGVQRAREMHGAREGVKERAGERERGGVEGAQQPVASLEAMAVTT